MVIRGHFDNLRQADFFIYTTDCNKVGLDTIHVQSGRFEYKAPLAGPAVYHLIYPHFVEQVIFANSGDVIDVEGDASNLREVKIDGNDENKEYTRLRMTLNDVGDGEERDSIVKTYIETHRDSRVSAYLQQMMNIRGPLRPLIREGARLPRFVLANDTTGVDTLEGNPVAPRLINTDALSCDSLLGHQSLIVFLHHWSYDRYSTMHKVHEMMLRNDSLRTLLYSVDVDYTEFWHSMRRDSALSDKYKTRWYGYCDRLGLRSQLVTQWRISEFPYFVLVDEKGVVKSCAKEWEGLKW